MTATITNSSRLKLVPSAQTQTPLEFQAQFELVLVSDYKLYQMGIKKLIQGMDNCSVNLKVISNKELKQEKNLQADAILIHLNEFSNFNSVVSMAGIPLIGIVPANNFFLENIQENFHLYGGFIEEETFGDTLEKVLFVIHNGGRYYPESITKAIAKLAFYAPLISRSYEVKETYESLSFTERRVFTSYVINSANPHKACLKYDISKEVCDDIIDCLLEKFRVEDRRSLRALAVFF